MTRLLPLAFMSLVAVVACSEAVSPPTQQPVVGDTLLAGEATAVAIDAVVDKAPTAAPDSEVDGDFIRTRLTAVVNPSATVGQVNDALLANGARISASVEGVPFVVLSIPPVADEAAARAVADALVATGAFLLAKPERLSPIKQARVLPASGDTGISHLLPGRLPAAWNVKDAVAARARVIVGDWFHQLTPIATVTPLRFLPSSPQTPDPGENHGFHVAGILAADHDASDFTGAFPRADRIDVDGVSLLNLSWPEKSLALLSAFPATGNFLISTSLGYPSGPTNDTLAFEYAMDALHWRMLVWNDRDRFLHLTAASNEGDSAGMAGQAFSSSPYNLARFQADLLTYVEGLAVPEADKAAFTVLWSWAAANQPLALQASPNLLSVGSSSRTGVESGFSSRGSDVRAVGEQVFAPCVTADPDLVTYPDDCDGTRARYSGTSMATPLVAGIAAYLWALEPSLTPVQLRDILQDAYNSAWVGGVLDAYLAVQLLDQSLADAVIRRALLDVATATAAQGTDGRFDEFDVEQFRLEFDDYAFIRDAFADPNLTDYSRYDLNGDGITGDSTRFAPFDLDADRVLGAAYRTIEGEQREFNETFVSDLGILCYYAYSSLYQGDPQTLVNVLPECSSDSGVGSLPGVPPSFVDVESTGWAFRTFAGDGSPVNGAGNCIDDEQNFIKPPPVDWRATGTCTVPDGSVTGTVTVKDDDRGRGSSRGEISGRFQTTAAVSTAATVGTGARVNHSLLVTSGSAFTGQSGQMRARVALKLRVQIPSFANQCPGLLARAEAEFRLNVFATSSIYFNPVGLARARGCYGGTTPTSSGEITDTLEFPIDFAFDMPLTLDVRVGTFAIVVGQHSQLIDAFAEVEYHFVEFLDLPPGTLVRVGSGRTWWDSGAPIPARASVSGAGAATAPPSAPPPSPPPTPGPRTSRSSF